MFKAARIVVTGVVQGVGFRPAVYRLAVGRSLKGYVRNVGGSEVEIWVEGDYSDIRAFINDLMEKLPPPAELESLEVEFREPANYSEFRIVKSGKVKVRDSMIPPDFGMCSDCLREVLDPTSRFYRYPFNSCAWCGPRYSMMYSVPYDRPNTAMRDFPLCEDCRRDYEDPNNLRRFHAQGISCPKCGPKVELKDREWKRVEVKDPVREAGKLINEGHIVAVKGVGGYHIAALPTDDDVLRKLRERKRRKTKPFAVMALNTEVASKAVYLSEEARKLLESPSKPIVLLPKREDTPLSPLTSPGFTHEGIFLPYTPLHYLLLAEIEGNMSIMTSGNARGKPMCTDEQCVRHHLKNVVDYVLTHNREIVNRVDDSVIRFTDGQPVFLRRGRGYAPKWIRLKGRLSKGVTAFGADIHNVGAVAFEDKVVLTQYIGEADDPDVVDELLKYVGKLADLYLRGREFVVVVDKHPRYRSREAGELFAKTRGAEVIEVQHHLSHIMSVIGDRGLEEGEYVGVAIDGVGFGEDGNVWGCEVFRVKPGTYRRVAHLRPFRLTGSDRDVVYPVRVLTALITEFFGRGFAEKLIREGGYLKYFQHGEMELDLLFHTLRQSRVLSTSLGRLIDAISTLLRISWFRDFEGEPAIMLEEAASRGKLLDVWIELGEDMATQGDYLDPQPLLKFLIDYLSDSPAEDLAVTALQSIGFGLGTLVKKLIRGTRANSEILVSGGAAVNTPIFRGLRKALAEVDAIPLLPSRVPPNDGGIALGQVVAWSWFYE